MRKLIVIAAVALALFAFCFRPDSSEGTFEAFADESGTRPATHYHMAPTKSAAANSARLAEAFGAAGSPTIAFEPGVYNLECRSFTAASSVSLIGSAGGETILKLPTKCAFSTPFMTWDAKSKIRLSNLTIDLNSPTYRALQPVLLFSAYGGSAKGLRIDHVRMIRATSPSLLVTVGATSGNSYEGVSIQSNVFKMNAATSTNQCIALTTVNGTGFIPSAQIVDNMCAGTAVQIDGTQTVVAGNDISGFMFGNAIYAQQNIGRAVSGARWGSGTVTLSYPSAPHFFVVGQDVAVRGSVPATYNGDFVVTATTDSTVSFRVLNDPGIWRSGGYVISTPSNRDCLILGNVMHDTVDGIDINRAVHNGLENSCIGSIVIGNRARNLGGSGFANFASGSMYVSNSSYDTGFIGSGSAGEEGDKSAYLIFDAGLGLDWYASRNVTLIRNKSGFSRPEKVKFGYFEEPYHFFETQLLANTFLGGQNNAVIRPAATVDRKEFANMSIVDASTPVTNISVANIDGPQPTSWKLTCYNLRTTKPNNIGVQFSTKTAPAQYGAMTYITETKENFGGAVSASSSRQPHIVLGGAANRGDRSEPITVVMTPSGSGLPSGQRKIRFYGYYARGGIPVLFSGTSLIPNGASLATLRLSVIGEGSLTGSCILDRSHPPT